MDGRHLTREELEAGLLATQTSPLDQGALELIVCRPRVGEREVLEAANLDPGVGVVGDTWKTRESSRTPDRSAHPEMQLNVINSRVIALIAGGKDRWPLAGDQLYVDLDLGSDNVPPGTRLEIGSAVIEVTAQPHTGCGKFVERFGVEAMKFVNSSVGRQLNLRGINARVVHPGTIRRGDAIRKVPPDVGTLLDDVATRAATYLREADCRPIAPPVSAIDALAELNEPLPEDPSSPPDVVALLDRVGSAATVINTGGRYFGFVNGGALPASVAASWMAAAWGQNASLRVMAPGAVAFEDVALEWTRDVLGLPEGAGGALTTGATMANVCGLAAARHALLERAGWDVENDGLFGAPPLDVVVGHEVHVSLLKALGLLGLGRARVHRVPVDDQGRMRAEALPRLTERTIVCLQAGNVNTGAFDPAEHVCARAREAGAWVHVDGAFGLWAAVSPRYRHLAARFADADSWATDGHKWPNAGYDCGIAFSRDPRPLRLAMAMTAAYLPPGESREPAHYTPEMSRRARGVELWATLRSLGRRGLADLIERTCRHAQRFAEGFHERGFAVLNDVVINQVLVSFGPPELTRAVIARVQEEGTSWCGGTEWQGHVAMRVSVSSWATTDADVEKSLESIVRVAAAVHRQRP